MFYLYSTPNSFEQKIHNFLAKALVLIGRCIGVGWRKRSHNGPYYTNAHRNRRLLCYLTNSIAIAISSFVIFDRVVNHEGLDVFLVGTLSVIVITCYHLLMISFLMTVMMRQRRFLKTFNIVYNLHVLSQFLFKADSSRNDNGLFIKCVIKIGLDVGICCTLEALFIGEFFKERTISSLICSILMPPGMVVYCYVGTTYFISLAYGLFLRQRAHEAFETVHTSNVTTFYHNILTFVKKVHGTFQLSLLFLVTHAFLEFVIQVTLYNLLL